MPIDSVRSLEISSNMQDEFESHWFWDVATILTLSSLVSDERLRQLKRRFPQGLKVLMDLMTQIKGNLRD